MLYCTILYYTFTFTLTGILHDTMLYHTILGYVILYYAMLYHTILCYTILYYIILYYIIRYCTILYYAILYYTSAELLDAIEDAELSPQRRSDERTESPGGVALLVRRAVHEQVPGGHIFVALAG